MKKTVYIIMCLLMVSFGLKPNFISGDEVSTIYINTKIPLIGDDVYQTIQVFDTIEESALYTISEAVFLDSSDLVVDSGSFQNETYTLEYVVTLKSGHSFKSDTHCFINGRSAVFDGTKCALTFIPEDGGLVSVNYKNDVENITRSVSKGKEYYLEDLLKTPIGKSLSYYDINGIHYRDLEGVSIYPDKDTEIKAIYKEMVLYVGDVLINGSNDDVFHDGTVKYNALEGTLTLKNASLKDHEYLDECWSGIYTTGPLKIVLEGDNTISKTGNDTRTFYGIYGEDRLSIEGASLKIEDKNEMAYKSVGIYCGKELLVDASLEIDLKDRSQTAIEDMVVALVADEAELKNSFIKFNLGNSFQSIGLNVDKNLVLNNTELVASINSDGYSTYMTSGQDVKIKDSIVHLKDAGLKSEEVIGIYAYEDILIEDTLLDISLDGLYAYGLYGYDLSLKALKEGSLLKVLGENEGFGVIFDQDLNLEKGYYTIFGSLGAFIDQPSVDIEDGCGLYYGNDHLDAVRWDGVKDLDSAYVAIRKEHQHHYALKYDAYEHWSICECLDVLDKGMHYDLNGDYKCDVCNYLYYHVVNTGVYDERSN